MKTDRFTGTGSGPDRIATFAAYYENSTTLMATQLATFTCGRPHEVPSDRYDLNSAVTNAARDCAG